jgi:gliding motility-associated-like protein
MFILVILPGRLFARDSSMDSACIPVVAIAEDQNNICIGTAITFHASVINDGTNGVYKWKKNNGDAIVSGTANYTSTGFHEGDVVICEYNCKTACGVDTTVVSNPVTMHVINDISPSVTVSNYDTLICEGEVAVFIATPYYYGNALLAYQWKVNGNPVGTNGPVYSTDSLTNGSKVECTLTASTPYCPGTSKSATAQLTIYVYPLIHPAIKIMPTKTEICRGEEVIFTATANGGAYPAFTWKINGIPTGADAPSLTTSTLQDGDTVSCIVTIDQDSRCHTTTSAPSNEIVMHVHDYTDPTVEIDAPTLDVCTGGSVTFTATPNNAGGYRAYQWQVNGHYVTNNLSTFTNNQFENGDTVSCILSTSIPGCAIIVIVSSNDEVVTIRDAPVITLSPPEITIMAGEQAQLHASVSDVTTSTMWTPREILLTPQSLTSSTVPLWHDTVFNLSVVDINGCTASKDLVVTVLHKLYMPSSFTPNKDGKNDVFRIPPGASISLGEFLVFDSWGNSVFTTTDISKSWDGTNQGKDLDTGIYVYLIKGVIQNKEVVIKGTVALLR